MSALHVSANRFFTFNRVFHCNISTLHTSHYVDFADSLRFSVVKHLNKQIQLKASDMNPSPLSFWAYVCCRCCSSSYPKLTCSNCLWTCSFNWALRCWRVRCSVSRNISSTLWLLLWKGHGSRFTAAGSQQEAVVEAAPRTIRYCEDELIPQQASELWFAAWVVFLIWGWSFFKVWFGFTPTNHWNLKGLFTYITNIFSNNSCVMESCRFYLMRIWDISH